jgi:hypothetical protein
MQCLCYGRLWLRSSSVGEVVFSLCVGVRSRTGLDMGIAVCSFERLCDVCGSCCGMVCNCMMESR